MPTLQHFELRILVALLRRKADTYSTELVRMLDEQADKAVAPAAVFIALSRLEKKGLVQSRLDAAAGPRPRRYFSLTPAGVSAVRTHHLESTRLWQGIDRLLHSRKA